MWPAIEPSEPLVAGAVRLTPITTADRDGLADAAADGALWRLWYASVPQPAAMAAFIQRAQAEQADGVSCVFTVRDAAGRIVGSTRLMHIDRENRRVEIGHTWYAASVQRTAVNTQAKRLLLGHAFDTADAIAVEFRTHWHNRASRAAIERLGAKQDGVLRQHRFMADGAFRDTVVYSIIHSEWPAVRAALDHRLADAVTPRSGDEEALS